MANRTNRALAALVLALVCVWAVSSAGARQAADPVAAQEGVDLTALTLTVIPYQGRLSDPSTGDAVADGNYTMTFRLYDVVTGGSALWTETKDVAVQGGVFSTALGDSASLSHSLFNGQALWLGVKVGSDAEATPRQQLLPVAYALSLVPGAVIKSSGSTTGLRVTTTGSGDALQVSGPTSLEGDLTVTGSLNGANHTHSGEQIASGTVAEARIHTSIARDSEIVPTVLTNDGPGSGLDADLLDGQQASAFAGATHNHSGGDITTGTVAEGRIADAIARDGEIVPIVLANDGTGSTLDADLLDGKQSTEFSLTTHSHDHGALTGLGDDDHTQYFNLSQNEMVTGIPAFYGGTTGSTPPFNVDSTYVVSRLNADLLDGADASSFALASHSHPSLPIAYAFIGNDGSKLSGTANVSSLWSSANTRYEITISGHSYFWTDYVTTITTSSACGPAVATASSVSGKLLVYIIDTGGNHKQCYFQFVTFKP